MKTLWENSARTEAERLLHCAKNIAVGFYRINNFIVLPFTPKVSAANLVTFPNLEYNSIPRFWEKVKKIDTYDFPLIIDKKLVDQTIKLIEKANLPKPNFEKTKASWEKAQKGVLNEIYKVMPSKKGIIKEIIIYSTSFGTGGSFNLFNQRTKDGKFIMYLREDKGIHEIAEAIITSLTRLDVYSKLEGLWQESELLADWLVAESSIATVLQKYEKPDSYIGTIKGVRTKQQAKLLKQSEEFYKKLGVPGFDKPFSLNGLNPEINKKPLENLNINERLILKKLIESSNSIVTFDDIADKLFKGDENFSLYAISKTIKRIRTKLEKNGISGSYIQTLRGKGYLLKN